MIKAIAKYNFTIWISGLHNLSRQVAGKTCFLNLLEGLSYSDPAKSLRRDGTCVLKESGNQLLKSGKFPTLTRIEFPEDPKLVRDFIRLVIRTKTPLSEAVLETRIKIEDLSRFQPRLIYTR
jgi:hypothetical protein